MIFRQDAKNKYSIDFFEMTSSACLIFNPIAGQGNPDIELEQIRLILAPEIDLDIVLTTVEVGVCSTSKSSSSQRCGSNSGFGG